LKKPPEGFEDMSPEHQEYGQAESWFQLVGAAIGAIIYKSLCSPKE